MATIDQQVVQSKIGSCAVLVGLADHGIGQAAYKLHARCIDPQWHLDVRGGVQGVLDGTLGTLHRGWRPHRPWSRDELRHDCVGCREGMQRALAGAMLLAST